MKKLSREVYECLTQNILPFWLDNMLDTKRGGWYGQMTGKGRVEKEAPRGAILYARLLWTFSAAYRVLKHTEYLNAATMTKDYILAHFMDKEYGGTYWSVTADGQPLDTKKQFYAQGFMLYGFSEYARATGNEEALQTSIELFNIMRFDIRLSFLINTYMEQFVPYECVHLIIRQSYTILIVDNDQEIIRTKEPIQVLCLFAFSKDLLSLALGLFLETYNESYSYTEIKEIRSLLFENLSSPFCCFI